jgi:hypothetical protein
LDKSQEKNLKKGNPTSFKKGNPNSKINGSLGGRPKGSKNKLSMAMLAGSVGKGQDMLDKAYEMGMAGDTTAMRIFLDKVLPNAKERQIQIDMPVMNSLDDIEPAHNKLIEHINKGDVTLSEADEILKHIEYRRKNYETKLIQAIEKQTRETAQELEKLK